MTNQCSSNAYQKSIHSKIWIPFFMVSPNLLFPVSLKNLLFFWLNIMQQQIGIEEQEKRQHLHIQYLPIHCFFCTRREDRKHPNIHLSADHYFHPNHSLLYCIIISINKSAHKNSFSLPMSYELFGALLLKLNSNSNKTYDWRNFKL